MIDELVQIRDEIKSLRAYVTKLEREIAMLKQLLFDHGLALQKLDARGR